MDPVIQINQVSKSFGKKNVLSKIDLSIHSGQIYGLIGPSGSGKTTLIKIIVGMDSTSTGTVHVLNTTMPNLNILQRIGYMAHPMHFILN